MVDLETMCSFRVNSIDRKELVMKDYSQRTGGISLLHTAFIQKAEECFQTSYYEGRAFICYFDFAEFKLINRHYGVEGGNALLRAAEARLNQIPQVAVCERIVSDQFMFLIIASGIRSDEEIIRNYTDYAENFLSKRRSQFPCCNLRTYCGICPVRNGNVLEAIDNANIAWRKAKKNKVTSAVMFDDSMLESLLMHQRIEREINMALQEGRFVFYLQLKVDLLTGEIIGAEALARRLDADGKVAFPDMFLSVMEEEGSVVELDYLILRKVCADMRERLDKGIPVVQTSVNLSRLHIEVWDSARRIHTLVQEYRIPPSLLEFELTETILLDQFAGAQSLCNQLREYGYSMSIDDFGAGYAGVNILQELDFDALKLDRRFLAEEEPLRHRNRVILPDIIHSLRELHITPLCEGVETAEQCRYLADIGCKYVQGFYFSEPVPPEQFYETYQYLNGRYPISSVRNRAETLI